MPSASSSRNPERRGGALVLVDTNAWFLPLRTPLRFSAAIERAIGAHRLAAPASVLGELDRLVERGIPDAPAARRLAQGVPAMPTTGRGDAGVLACARRHHAWVLTADRALLRRIRAEGLNGLAPRGPAGLVAILPDRKTINPVPRMNRRPGRPARRG